MNTEETTNRAMKHPEAYLYERYDEAYKNTKPGQAYPDYWPSYVVDAFKAYARDLGPAIGGAAVPRTSVAPGPEGYRPDNQRLNQETKQLTAEETLIQEYLKYNSHVTEDKLLLLPLHYPAYIIAAMHTYAKSYAEADRKDCAEKARVGASSAVGIKEDGGPAQVPYYFVDKSSILDRPYPEMP